MLSSPLADIDAVNAATAARTKERCIVCENMIYVGSNESEDSRKTPYFYVLNIVFHGYGFIHLKSHFEQMTSAQCNASRLPP